MKYAYDSERINAIEDKLDEIERETDGSVSGKLESIRIKLCMFDVIEE